MKPLKSYLSPKSQWHAKEFPSTPKLEDILEFFKNCGFTEVPYRANFSVTSLLNKARYDQENSFVYNQEPSVGSNEDTYIMRFCKAQDINKKKYTVYFLKLSKSGEIHGDDVAYIETWLRAGKNLDRKYVYYIKLDNQDKKFEDYDKFVNELKIDFGWK